jgi:hypothetical protein
MAGVRAIVCVFVAGCVGDVGGGGGGSGSGSGSGSAHDASVDAPKLMWVDASMGGGNTLPCENVIVPSPTNGNHFPGQSCFQNCHNHGFTLAGTLYTNSTGNSGFEGATITITDSNNVTLKLVTAVNGNFYTRQALTFPVLTMASACPSAVRMTLAVAESGRACNSCHASGPNQMHLP